MVMTDFSMQVSKAQALTGTTATSTLGYDLTVARDPGEGEPMLMRVRVTTAFVGAGTLRFVAIANDTLILAGATVGASADFAAAALFKNAEFFIQLGPISAPELPTSLAAFPTLGAPTHQGEFAQAAGKRLLYAVYLFSAGSTLTGAVTTDFCKDPGSYAKTYPRSYQNGIGGP